MLPLIRLRKLWYTISAIAVGGSVAALVLWGLNVGIDFTGGTALEVRFEAERPRPQAIQEVLGPLKLGQVVSSPVGEKDMTLRLKPITDEERRMTLEKLEESFGGPEKVGERQFETVGPVIGAELKRKTVWAIAFAIFAISLYITWSFRRVSYPIKSWKYGACTVIALLHDVIIPTGVYALLGRVAGAEVGVLFVTALLTILGFSVHDTIVVFDRIRENLPLNRSLSFAEVVNKSLNQTIARSINTSLTVLLVLVATYLFGGASIKDFVLTIIIGIVVGTYSSIFLASPLLVSWYEWEQERGRRGSIA